jgi:high-affinity K+ transport system ATPase subunit B
VTAYHKVILPILFLTLVGSVVNLYQSWGEHQRIYSASLIVVLTVCLIFTFLFARTFPLKAQDRAIRAEENLRHFAMTGKLLDPRLSVKQVVGLRFASDEEFVALARKAAEESLTPDAIKRAVKNWRADTYRV